MFLDFAVGLGFFPLRGALVQTEKARNLAGDFNGKCVDYYCRFKRTPTINAGL